MDFTAIISTSSLLVYCHEANHQMGSERYDSNSCYTYTQEFHPGEQRLGPTSQDGSRNQTAGTGGHYVITCTTVHYPLHLFFCCR